ncbi:MAG TPA: tyrosine-type recombinase/integrase [Steroidobacteraceae bacterium]|nr:tyrosine-type recombinase/integrase [Steroidobacteraceae bacterium]
MRADRNLTQHLIDTARARSQEYTLWDKRISGFGLRVRPTGARTYVVVYRNPASKVKKFTMGKPSAYTLEQARKRAQEILYQVTCNLDPAANKANARKTTVSVVYEEYKKRRASEFSDGHQTRVDGIFQSVVLPHLGQKPIGAVTRSDILELTDKKRSVGKNAAANNIHRVVSAFLTWSHTQRGYLDANPMAGMSLPCRHHSRARVLKDKELAALWHGTAYLNPQWRSAIRLLMLTGMRRNEVLDAKLEEVDLHRLEWVIPEERTKNRHPHRVHLTPFALKVLEGIPTRPGQTYLFQSEVTFHARSVAQTTASIRLLKRTVRLDNWRLHDLRRSVATHMASLGVPPHVIQVVLNHRSGIRSGVTAIYNRYDYLKEATDAWAKWSAALEEWVTKTYPPAAPPQPVLEEVVL